MEFEINAEEIFEQESEQEIQEAVNFEFKDEVIIKTDSLKKYEYIEDITNPKTKLSKIGRIVEIKPNGDIMVDFWSSKPAKNKIDKEDLELHTKWHERDDVAAKDDNVQSISPVSKKNEAEAKPDRYNQGTIEVWDAIVGMNADYMQGNICKYIMRYKHKNGLEDLYKVLNYTLKIIANETEKDYYCLRNKTIEQITKGDY